MASRLADNNANSVAVVEAGGLAATDNGNYSSVPAYGAFYSGTSPDNIQPLVDWNIVTVPQTVCH